MWEEPMTPTEKAVALMKTIGLDITYTDEGLRIVAEQIGEAYRADERDRIRTELLSLASERAGVAGRNTALTGFMRRYLIDLASVLDVVGGSDPAAVRFIRIHAKP